MKKTLFAVLSLTLLVGHAYALDYRAVPDWQKLPTGYAQLGNMHGDIAVSANGEVYVSLMDSQAGLLVFAPDGTFRRKVPNAPNDFHGFVIHQEKEGEFIYGPRMEGQSIVKMTLEGRVIFEIPASAIPDQFKIPKPKSTKKNALGEVEKDPAEGKLFVRLTGLDIAPNGDLFVTDGYASDYVHRFDRKGTYLNSFGGKQAPYGFHTLHKIAIDPRFTPARIIACDRANMRVVHLSLDGEFLGVVARDLLMPAAVAIHGDYAAIGELRGPITILDKTGRVVAKFATNPNASEVGTNKTEPVRWRPGIVNAPHGVAFNEHGDLFVSEYSLFGRVHRFNLQ
ncbi:MAG: hypothetical protein EXS39_03715 [Opitutaceae bacterium]|nr:hypothetical protein [Opitutaceae bacterium]